MNSVLHIKDLSLPSGVKTLQDEDLIVATVREIEEEAAAAPVEGESAEPELIGRKATDEEAAAGEEGPRRSKTGRPFGFQFSVFSFQQGVSRLLF